MKKIIAIVGARPQFIKHFALEKEAEGILDFKTIHTGQHYDSNMSQVFFDELRMRRPDYSLSLGGGLHGEQTGKMLLEIERILMFEKPERVIVYGDTNSTLAGALASVKLQIPLAHVEAGLRSYNREMPEEINRILTDHVSEWHFAPSDQAKENLGKEGIKDNVFVVGDIMKDLVLKAVSNNWIIQPRIDLKDYYYATIHRPYNTDSGERLSYILSSLNALDKEVVFSVHPRTRKLLDDYGLRRQDYKNVIFIDPQGYFENLGFLYHSDGLITDSGGMQKEAYWLMKRCVTIRTETEWVETLNHNWNQLLFEDLNLLKNSLNPLHIGWHDGLYGLGNSAKQIIDVLK
jgi:UDP-GlcNAc3NAcA epimerase